MDDTGIAIGLLILLLLFAACVGAGIISNSVWNAAGIAITLALLLAFVFYVVVRATNPAHDVDLITGVLIFQMLKYLLPAAPAVAAIASIISNGGRLHRAPKDKT